MDDQMKSFENFFNTLSNKFERGSFMKWLVTFLFAFIAIGVTAVLICEGVVFAVSTIFWTLPPVFVVLAVLRIALIFAAILAVWWSFDKGSNGGYSEWS
ncbi:hypothetical protein [Shimia sp.]|uniref:hypothetical protein n=1 Tax=Shimia sp. TaxID=1954381 RepID=UPI003BAD2BD6